MIYVTGSCEKLSDIAGTLEYLATLQLKDPLNCYICPLNAFSHLKHKLMPKDMRIELREDLLTCCEKLIVVGEIDDFMQAEIDLANQCKMEVEYRL